MTLRDSMVGRVVDGRYLIESPIASGAMASVYLALDRRLERQVALKVMHEHLATDAEFAARFVREAKAAARLSHPNVVQVFDQGSDGPVLYLAMEYLPGRTLRDLLTRRGAMTPRESVSALEPVLSALAAAHRAGLVHGDVKPENVIMTDDGRIKMADFGLARAITAPISSSATGELLGTVAYLSPELVRGGTVDARADVYAAGIMLFELLTGKQPFSGPDPLAVAHRHVSERVPAPSSVAPGLPRAFDDLVLRATDHSPDRRPGDAGAFLTDLQAALAHLPQEQLDLRAPDPAALRLRPDAIATEVLPVMTAASAHGAPAAATHPQPTLVMTVPRRRVRSGPPRSSRLPRPPKDSGGDRRPGGGLIRRRPGWPVLAVAVIVVLLLLGTGAWWFTAGPGSYLDAPSLVGQSQSDAQRTLSGEGLSSRVSSVFDPKVAAGTVISADPMAGEHVKKHGTVNLVVSKGPQLVAVPDVGGFTVTQATGELLAAKLKVGTTTSQYYPAVPVGQVISTSPNIGTRIAAGQPVNLLVSGAGVLKGLASGRCLDVPSGSQVNGTRTVLQDCNGGTSQAWAASPSGQLTVYGGTKCLDVAGGSTDDGAIVQIYDCSGGSNQQWTINPDGSIVSAASGKCLDATDHGTDNGTPIQIWSCSGDTNQKWSRT